MKSKVKRGSGFRGLLNYLLDKKKHFSIIGGNMNGQTAKDLAQEFSYVRDLRPDCKRPVLHISIRMPQGEDVTAKKWNQIVVRFLEEMGLSSNRPWLLVKHDNEHVHLVISRIDYLAELWLGKWEALMAIKATHKLEPEFGLTITPTLGNSDMQNVRLTSGQLKKAAREIENEREVEIPVKQIIADKIAIAIEQSDGTFEHFRKLMHSQKVNVSQNEASTGHVSGISFEFNGIVIKGSKIARTFSWNGISEKLRKKKEYYECKTNKPNIGSEIERKSPDRSSDNSLAELPNRRQQNNQRLDSDQQQKYAYGLMVADRSEYLVGNIASVANGPVPSIEAPDHREQLPERKADQQLQQIGNQPGSVELEHKRPSNPDRYDHQSVEQTSDILAESRNMDQQPEVIEVSEQAALPHTRRR